MVSIYVYCDNCGAANRVEATLCFACHQPLQPTAEEQISSSTAPLVNSHLLIQRYRILGQLGRGGFGAIYQAEDIQFGNWAVAIKEMNPVNLSPLEIAEATEAFKHEALLLANLTHPNLPRIYDHFSDAGRWYLVMDFIEGETLEEYLQKAPGGYLPVEEALDTGMQLCSVLGYLHTYQPPIAFRDLKPANIMLTPANDLYLVDFSIAHHFRRGQARADVAFGTPGYAAPEQYGSVPPTPGSDIYSLGATLHHLLSGNDPSETPFCFAPLQSCPAGLQTLIVQMVDMDESKRPANLAAIEQALQRITSGGQIEMAPPGVLQALQSPTVHRPTTSPGQILPAPGIVAKQIALQRRPVPGKRGKTKRVHAIVVGNRGFSLPRRKFVVGLVGLVVVGGGITWIHDILSQKSATLYTYSGHSNWVYSVAWSPNGKRIASASADGTVQVWDALTGSNVYTYTGHVKGYTAQEALPIRTGEVYTYPTPDKNFAGVSVNAVAWSPDGKPIASGAGDETVQVWQPG